MSQARTAADYCREAAACLETAAKLYDCPNSGCNGVVQAIHWTNKANEAIAKIPKAAGT